VARRRSVPRGPHRATGFPYATLFRSRGHAVQAARLRRAARTHRLPQDAQGGVRLLHQGGPRLMALVPQMPDPILTVDHMSMKFGDRKSTRLNSSHVKSPYAGFCLKTT